MKSQLGLCFPLHLHDCLRGDSKDLLTGCGATQFPREGEAELAVIVDAKEMLDILVQLYLQGKAVRTGG